jgi:hypothetical protein
MNTVAGLNDSIHSGLVGPFDDLLQLNRACPKNILINRGGSFERRKIRQNHRLKWLCPKSAGYDFHA